MRVDCRLPAIFGLSLACVFALFLFPSFAYADAGPKWTDAQLVEFSTVVVRGRVTRIATALDSSVSTPYTLVTLDVTDVVKGSVPGGRLTLKQLGGRLGQTALEIAGQPRFTIGEDVVVFLEVRPRDGTLTTTASWQGKFTIAGGASSDAVASRAEPAGAARGIFSEGQRAVLPWLQELRAAAARTGGASATAVDLSPAAGDRVVSSTATARTAASWDRAGARRASIRVDMVGPLSAAAAAREGAVRDAADYWTSAGIASLAAGGLQPQGCFLARAPDGRISVGIDTCGELDPRGGTIALAGTWVGSDGRAIGAGILTNAGDSAQRFLNRASCFGRALTHELGHVLGVNHSADGAGAMGAFLACDGGFGTVVPTGSTQAAAAARSASTAALVPRPMLLPLTSAGAAPIAAGIERISVSSNGAQANGPSHTPSVSADGRYVAFQSAASNLVGGDANNQLDIFVRDRAAGVTTRENLGPGGVEANAASSQPVVSADGRYVAFESSATNLVSGITGSHIYVRDRVQGVTIVADVSTGGAPADNTSFRPTISGDGRFVGFDSSATNLVPGDTNGCLDVFTHDIATPGPTSRESVASASTQVTCGSGEIGSFFTALSSTARYVAFASDAVSLLPPGMGPLPACNLAHCHNVYVHDRNTGATTLESVATNGSVLNATQPSISADGRYLTFQGQTTVANNQLYVRDRNTGQTVGVTPDGSSPKISPDGRYVTYLANGGVVLYDRVLGQYLNVVTDGTEATIGGVVAFASVGAWVVNDTNQDYDIFVAPLSGAPSAPTGLAFSLTGSTLTLTWSAPVGGGVPTAYTIEAGTASGASDIANFSTGSTATTFSATVGGNGIFYIRVRSTNTNGASVPSNEIVVVVGTATAPPGPPSGLTASASGSTVALSWSPPTTGGAPTSYVIEAGSRTGAADLANFNTGSTATTFSAAGVGAGTYFVRVRAANGSGASAPSNEAILIVAPGCVVPAAPANVAATVNGSTVTIAWSSAADATSYLLEAGSGPSLTDILVSNLGSSSTSLTAVNVGAGTYFVRLRGLNACGQSGPSNEVLIIVR